MTETDIQGLIRVKASERGNVLWRNNNGALVNKNSGNDRPIRFGLGNDSKELNAIFKSSDLIGITPVVITADMVGQTLGVFTAVEVKEEGWTWPINPSDREIAQCNFLNFVVSMHGYAQFAASTQEYTV